MGCPDWPKCFGSFVPPTNLAQLPTDYGTTYNHYRKDKNEKFARFLESVGLKSTANQLRNDPSALAEEPFNATKTWIEYINRLIGAVVGLLLSILLVVTIRQPGKSKWYALLAWILVIITGWFGSIVVSSNLTPWTVSVHLALAFGIVIMLTFCTNALTVPGEPLKVPQYLPLALIAILALQIYFGIQVRGEIDLISSRIQNRNLWIEQTGTIFLIHRSCSWLLLISSCYFSWLLFKIRTGRAFGISIISLILGLIFSGTIMTYFGIPWIIQPVHLLLATLTLTILLWTFLRTEKIKTNGYTGHYS